MPVQHLTRAQLFGDLERVRAAYGQSIQYTWNALVSFVQHYGDDNLVLVVLGDHQPVEDHHRARARVTTCRSRSSPTTRWCWTGSRGWGWADGLLPGANAPVWRMSAFRDRFFGAFGS